MENQADPLYLTLPTTIQTDTPSKCKGDVDEDSDDEQPFTPSSRAQYARKDLSLKFNERNNGDNDILVSKV